MSSARVYSFKKIDAILDALAKDSKLRSLARTNAVSAVKAGGFDLSPGELVLLVDIVTGSRQSPLNDMPNPVGPNPPGDATTDFVATLRAKWSQVP